MYSIFSTKSKTHTYLEEGEPPPKKIVTEGDVLIKNLADNQLKTDVTLAEHLNQKKEFTSSETFTEITSHIRGKTNLRDFKLSVATVDELNKLKSKGLNDSDIQLYKDYLDLGPEFWLKYKEVNKDALQQRVHEILQTVNSMDELNNDSEAILFSRHDEDYLNSLKPQSVEIKLLKFASKNSSRIAPFASVMDELPDLEEQMMYNVKASYTKCDIKRIRKKARSLGRKINDLTETVIAPADRIEKDNNYLQIRRTLWDMKDTPINIAKKIEVVMDKKNKVYSCTPQNWYTINEGRIIKLNKDKSLPERLKLTVQEIKNIPKFANYEAGSPSTTLFLKNLKSMATDEGFLRNILAKFQPECFTVRIMKGKMKGQAFIEFQGETQATEGLEALNGVLVEGQPIIAQFGRKKTS